jgi:hypothetical protein
MNVAGWILMILVSSTAGKPTIARQAAVFTGRDARDACADAAETYTPATFVCPPNAACAEPPTAEEIVVSDFCVRGFAVH